MIPHGHHSHGSGGDADEFSFEWEERQDDVPFGVHMLAGSIAGISEHTLLLPIDNLKTHLQTKSNSIASAFGEIRKAGLRSFYRGSTIIALGCVPSHALFFMNYEWLKRRVARQHEVDIAGNMLVGGVSSVLHDLIMTPCEMIKQRAQLLKSDTNLRIIKDTFRREGPRAFWRSFPVNFLGNLPSGMITVAANENLKHVYRRRAGEVGFLGYFLCSSSAGAFASLFTTPLDNIKTRLNVQQIFVDNLYKIKDALGAKLKRSAAAEQLLADGLLGKQQALRREFRSTQVELPNCKCSPFSPQNAAPEPVKYPNALCAVKIIYKEEGLRGFYKGLSMRMANQSLSSAVAWCVYEYAKRLFMAHKRIN